MTRLEHIIRTVIYSLVTAIIVTYVGQGVIMRLRLAQMNARLVDLRPLGESCDEATCRASWEFEPRDRLLLVGNILRTHSLKRIASDTSELPLSFVQGTVSDSWTRQRIYAVEPGATYVLSAEKAKATRMPYFMGLLPRTTNHEGVLSIPSIGPIVSGITALLSVTLLALMLAAASIGQNDVATSRGTRRHLVDVVILTATLSTVTCFISMGVLDSLLPEGELRSKILRLSLLASVGVMMFGLLPWTARGHRRLILTAIALVGALIGQLMWPWLRGGPAWAATWLVFLAIASTTLYRNGYLVAAGLLLLSASDALRMLGLIHYSDYALVYFGNVGVVSAFTLVATDVGGVATIAMAGIAYKRFKRDLGLKGIQTALSGADAADPAERVAMIADTLPLVANLTGAGRVSVTISLPLGRPFTQVYDATTGQTKLFDDGKILGAATLRSMIYGDEAILESYADFARRLRLPSNPDLSDASYFCALPLRVNRSILGTVMLTRFNDADIAKRLSRGIDDGMSEARETIRLAVERLATGLSSILVEELHVNSRKSKELQLAIQRCIGVSTSSEDFLWRYAAAIGKALDIQVMIHEQRDERGHGVAHAGMSPDVWRFFTDNPFNLSPNAAPAFGPSVVAFRDSKSSYLKDVREIFDRLHPKSREVLSLSNTGPMAAVPMRTTTARFVVSLTKDRDAPPFESGVVPMIESTEALFVAALEVMSQKTSVMALGQLASRLIGDDEVRDKILSAARSTELPTTVGSSRESFLLLFDLAGSSSLPHDPDAKARAYGEFYDSVNRRVAETLGGVVRKTIGDAVIVTWDGTDVALERQPDLLSRLESLTRYADTVARGIGCRGARAVLHHGSYFLGLVGTATFGQIDVIGRGIDEVCKAEGAMKTTLIEGSPVMLAISMAATARLGLCPDEYQKSEFISVDKNAPGAIQLSFVRTVAQLSKQETLLAS